MFLLHCVLMWKLVQQLMPIELVLKKKKLFRGVTSPSQLSLT